MVEDVFHIKKTGFKNCVKQEMDLMNNIKVHE
jgi:hypothetical protein